MAKYEVFTYKIAMIADSTNDALKMLLFMKNHPKVSMICMGEAGKFARILGVILGNLIDFASLNAQDETAPGQWSVKELVDIYHYPKLNQQTAIYGLIGDPVAQSPGDLHHNAVFRKRGVNAVYVKMRVRREELTLFMSLIQEIGIRGLSVTIPLKEAILPFAHEIDQPIGALNTLLFEEGKIRGINTDGAGALDAIEKKGSIYGKKVVLLGAGGAARSIAFEARARGAEVMIFNRTLARAKKLASETGCKALEQMPDRYDLLINCSSDPMPIDPQKIRAETTVMDIVYHPKETLLLKEALLKKCQVIYGEEMFLNQAERQTIFWLDA
jgi:3-dehydroquinate dehydratase/shikimate dehydrogenase